MVSLLYCIHLIISLIQPCRSYTSSEWKYSIFKWIYFLKIKKDLKRIRTTYEKLIIFTLLFSQNLWKKIQTFYVKGFFSKLSLQKLVLALISMQFSAIFDLLSEVYFELYCYYFILHYVQTLHSMSIWKQNQKENILLKRVR